jgi:hypothetical protein
MSDLVHPINSSVPSSKPLWRDELQALYEDLDRQVAALGPVCRLSGQCCRFAEYGHTLFVSSPEVQFLLDAERPAQRPLDRGETCPWQSQAGHCTARDARPLGCRVYYCDSSYEGAAQEISETFIARLKTLSNDHELPWNYAPLDRHLVEQPGGDRFPIGPALHDPGDFAAPLAAREGSFDHSR